jgi:hypothetical protein
MDNPEHMPNHQPPSGTELIVSAGIFIALVLWNWW